MNIDEAKELLSFHSGRNSDIDNPKWENGFLGSLRPFGGELHNEKWSNVKSSRNAIRSGFRPAWVLVLALFTFLLKQRKKWTDIGFTHVTF